jgi:hypothetical protein
MLKKFKLLGILMVVSQFIGVTYGCNGKYLEQEAGSYVTKLWSNIPITQSTLTESLGFLNDPEQVDHKYAQLNVIKELSQKSQDSLKGSSYPQFAQVCEKLFEESTDLRTQVAVHMLLERVYNKYSTEFNRIEKLRNAQEKASTQEEPSAAFREMFSHADKGINTNLIHSH